MHTRGGRTRVPYSLCGNGVASGLNLTSPTQDVFRAGTQQIPLTGIIVGDGDDGSGLPIRARRRDLSADRGLRVAQARLEDRDWLITQEGHRLQIVGKLPPTPRDELERRDEGARARHRRPGGAAPGDGGLAHRSSGNCAPCSSKSTSAESETASSSRTRASGRGSGWSRSRCWPRRPLRSALGG